MKHFQGEPKSTDLQLVEEELPPVRNGEFLVEAEYLSVDPYMRPYIQRFPVGVTMIGSQVAKIIESKHPDFPVGKRVVGYFGWRTHTIINQEMSSGDNFTGQKTTSCIRFKRFAIIIVFRSFRNARKHSILWSF